jgi:rfaE bifunctional protein kinase chain/domain/rfaE bifunctional protein nucleotidyltransferase chain/domain
VIKKIISIENLKKIIINSKARKKKIVLCHGVFDLLHVGHINHFHEAKTYGDILVVSVTADKYVNKGPNRPAFNQENRLKALAALKIIDYLVLNKFSTAVPVIRELKPNIYCKGKDYKFSKDDITGEIKNEINELKKSGGKVICTSGVVFSSSKLINRFGSVHSVKQKTIIEKIKKKYSFFKIKKMIENFNKLKVLVIGETIIDQYVFCSALGKSGKEPMLVLKDIKTEEYLGGAAAISKHLSSFCKKITLLSMLGEKKEFLKEIKSNLPKNVNFDYINKKNSPTIVKKRFLDHASNNKVLGVYKINYDYLNTSDEKLFSKKLKKLIPNYDIIIVSDYGHGLISEKSSKLICKKSKYLALNAQINAANLGYHSMRKYKNVDFFINNEAEIRHEMRDIKSKTEILIKKLSSQQNIKNLIVTRGKEGALIYNKKKNKFNSCAAFAKTALDKVGAGDAMLSVTALCLKNNFSGDLSVLIGSLAAAQSTETFGNKQAVSKIKILKTLEHLLK